jgi:2-polyprenyl-3-methyl-5-hydroxy-6-metoxy-1,4-benzoquinol methylase
VRDAVHPAAVRCDGQTQGAASLGELSCAKGISMFRNLINTEDVNRVRRKLAKGEARGIVAKLRGSSAERVVRSWDSDPVGPTAQWWEIEAVRRRWAYLISGDPDVDFPQYAVEKYLGGRTNVKAISVGCGHGARELRWAELGAFARIDAYDISTKSIATARQMAKERGLEHVVQFEVADVADLGIAASSYDVALGLHSLHHFKPVADVLALLSDALRPDGYLFVDDFVGPTRFQWTERQREAAEGLLRSLPERHRRVPGIGVRRKVVRPSVAWMVLSDPSEAIEADGILPALRGRFEVVEERPFGGSVLQLTLTDISQNFLDGGETTKRLLEWLFEAEDRLLAEGEVGHDFVALVARPRRD